MAWTPTIKSVNKAQGSIVFVVSYSNGTETVEKQYSSANIVDMEWVKRQIRNDISTMDTLYTLADSLQLGVLNTTAATPPTPTQAEIDRNIWLAKYYKLTRAHTTLIVPGIITVSQPTYAALLADVKATIKPEYIDYI